MLSIKGLDRKCLIDNTSRFIPLRSNRSSTRLLYSFYFVAFSCKSKSAKNENQFFIRVMDGLIRLSSHLWIESNVKSHQKIKLPQWQKTEPTPSSIYYFGISRLVAFSPNCKNYTLSHSSRDHPQCWISLPSVYDQYSHECSYDKVGINLHSRKLEITLLESVTYIPLHF